MIAKIIREAFSLFSFWDAVKTPLYKLPFHNGNYINIKSDGKSLDSCSQTALSSVQWERHTETPACPKDEHPVCEPDRRYHCGCKSEVIWKSSELQSKWEVQQNCLRFTELPESRYGQVKRENYRVLPKLRENRLWVILAVESSLGSHQNAQQQD